MSENNISPQVPPLMTRLGEYQAELEAINSAIQPDRVAVLLAQGDLSPDMRLQLARLVEIDLHGQISRVLEGIAAIRAMIQERYERNIAQLAISDPVTVQDYRFLGAVLLMIFIWLLVLATPVAIQKSDLPAETQQTLNDYYGLIAGLAVTITFLIAPKLMKKNGKK